MPKERDPRDVRIGQRIRFYRLKAKLSQEKVGDELDLTFQQIQKYEKGTNRISGARLMTLAALFKVKVTDFFGNDPSGGGGNSFDVSKMDTPRRVQIVELLIKRNDERIEDVVIDLLKTHRPWNRTKAPAE